MTALRLLEREKEISFDVLVDAIEQALLTAYHKTPGAQENARVQLDRRSGHVTVFAAELDDEGVVLDVEGVEKTVPFAEVKKAKVQIEFKKETP